MYHYELSGQYNLDKVRPPSVEDALTAAISFWKWYFKDGQFKQSQNDEDKYDRRDRTSVAIISSHLPDDMANDESATKTIDRGARLLANPTTTERREAMFNDLLFILVDGPDTAFIEIPEQIMADENLPSAKRELFQLAKLMVAESKMDETWIPT